MVKERLRERLSGITYEIYLFRSLNSTILCSRFFEVPTFYAIKDSRAKSTP